jgi:hypothetical protein
MTHKNNYEYVKKWRLNNRDKYLKDQRQTFSKRYNYKKVINELYNIDISLFL